MIGTARQFRQILFALPVFLALAFFNPAAARAETPAECRGFEKIWDKATTSGDETQIIKRRAEAEVFRDTCPDLLRRIDAYYPDDDVHRLAMGLVRHGFVKNNKVATDSAGIVAYGHDAVSLFESGFQKSGIVQGSFAYPAVHDGAIYLFSSATNQRKFLARPDAYIFAFGGYCAYCVAIGHFVGTDGLTVDRRDSQVYTFADDEKLGYWAGARAKYFAKAKANWAQRDWSQPVDAFPDSSLSEPLKIAIGDVSKAGPTIR